jgi:hypothetical protein
MFSAAMAVFDKKRTSDHNKVNENLELLVEDFKRITTDPLALKTLRGFLAAFRKEHQHAKIPMTIDQLFHRFLVNEKRKEYYSNFDNSRQALGKGQITHLTNQQMQNITKGLVVAQKNLITAEDKVLRFRNVQNHLFLKLLEREALRLNKKSTFFGGNLEHADRSLDNL